MGCGSSRMGGAGGDEVPARIRPLLRRRLEEMKKRSKANVMKGDQTLSKKELLRHGGVGSDEEEEMEHEGSMRSAKVAPEPDLVIDQDVNNKEVVYEEVVEKVIEVVKEDDDDGDDVDDVVVDDDDGDDVDDVVVDDDDSSEGHDDDDDDDDDDDGEEEEEEVQGRMSNFDERMICPGSPSFRVYCIDLSDSDDESEDKFGEEKKSETENGTTVVDAKEESTKRAKKARKGRRFGIPLPKATMSKKYLFNVTAPCYSAVGGRGCMGNQQSRLVQDKPSST